MRMQRPLRVFAAIAVLAGCAATKDLPPPRAESLAPSAWLIPGSFPQDRNPDGNTIVFEGAAGLIVMDTGRHLWHRQAILDFVAQRKQPVTAIINSHWHLDHTSGNAAIKDRFPEAKLYTGTAVDRMIRDVWPASIARSQALLDSGQAPAAMVEDMRGDNETRRNPKALSPDVPVTATSPVRIDGRLLELHLAPDAATDGDVWVFDPASGIAAVGDLVTLPVPFLDTACVAGWRGALAQISAMPFTKLVPGHGAPMNRSQFEQYRSAFENYAACAGATTDKSACAAQWLTATATLRAPEAPDDARAREMAEEYVDYLRENGGNAKLCRARPS